MRHIDITNGDYKSLTTLRGRLLKDTRDWFYRKGYLEIPCPHITGATGSCEWFPNAMNLDMYDELGHNKEMFLRQTAQLYLEAYTQIHNKVYTIGPSFRQEKKVTDRHLCEFTLIEFESRDNDLWGLLDDIENLIKTMFCAAFDYGDRVELAKYIDNKFIRVKYRDAIKDLQSIGFTIEHGDDLKKEHEIAICKKYDNLPVFITHYPVCLDSEDPNKVIKFFSMKRDLNTGETICADLLLPYVGESVGSAVREGNSQKCKLQLLSSIMFKHMKERGISVKNFEWYFEVLNQAKDNKQSSGCGIGFERVVQCILSNQTTCSIKNAIEIPRSPEYLNV